MSTPAETTFPVAAGMRAPPTAPNPPAAEVMTPQAASASLTEAELARLAECELVIRHGREIFIEVGLALNTIREDRLYRAGYCSFEQYCRERWEFGARQAYRICAAAEAVAGWRSQLDATPGSHSLPLPDSEKLVRALLRLPVADQLPVWTDAVSRSINGRPTAKQLDEMVTARLTLGSVPQETPPIRRLGRQTRPDQLALSTVLHHPPTPFRPFRVTFERPGDVHYVADQAIRKVRELVELLGTPDSVAAAGAGEALEKLERCKDQIAHSEKRQEART